MKWNVSQPTECKQPLNICHTLAQIREMSNTPHRFRKDTEKTVAEHSPRGRIRCRLHQPGQFHLSINFNGPTLLNDPNGIVLFFEEFFLLLTP